MYPLGAVVCLAWAQSPGKLQLWTGLGCAVSQIWGGEAVPSLGMLPEQILTPAEHLSVRFRNLKDTVFDVSKVILRVSTSACLRFYALL